MKWYDKHTRRHRLRHRKWRMRVRGGSSTVNTLQVLKWAHWIWECSEQTIFQTVGVWIQLCMYVELNVLIRFLHLEKRQNHTEKRATMVVHVRIAHMSVPCWMRIQMELKWYLHFFQSTDFLENFRTIIVIWQRIFVYIWRTYTLLTVRICVKKIWQMNKHLFQ